MDWSHNLINSYQSRIVLPKMAENHLSRENIMKIIDSASLEQIVCITAPFGYGKTQAALQWIHTHNCKAAFCSISKDDDCFETLLEYLTASVLSVVDESKDLDFKDFQYKEDPQKLLQELALSVKDTNQNYVLILKGLDKITDLDALKFLKKLIESILGTWRVLILNREMLPSIFNDLILTGCVRLITVEDLRLDINEIREFFRREKLEPDEEMLIRITLYTRGWFAALNVILMSSIAAKRFVYNQISEDCIMQFFEMEIWDILNEDMRDFLIKTSILDALDSSACYALTGEVEASGMIQWLYVHGIFILSREDGVYEYHPAFQKFLQRKLDTYSIDKNNLYTKFAWWLYSHKDYAAAFQYFYKAKFLFGVDKTLKKFDLSVMSIENFLDLVGEITTFNPHELMQYPNIVAKMALIEFLTGNIDRMKELSLLFYDWEEPGVLPISPGEYAEFYWEVGWLRYLDPDESQLNNKRLEAFANYKAYTPHLDSLHLARAAILSFPSFNRGIKDFSAVTVVIESFVSKVERGQQDIVSDGYALLEIQLLLAEYYYETDRLSEALEEIRKVLPQAKLQVYAHLYFICIALQVKIMRAMHDTKEIPSLTIYLEKTIRDKNSLFLLPNFHAFQQINYLKSGNVGFTETFSEENEHLLDKNHFYLLYRRIVCIQVLLSKEDYHQASIIANNLEVLCEKYKRVLDLMEVCILKSIALINLGDEKCAIESLKKAIHIGAPYGYIRVFSDNADGIIPVLSLLSKEMKSAYLTKIIISAKKTARRHVKFLQSDNLKLTNTELKILKSLQDDLSYNEISFEHNIKISTVRTHIQSIYGKLGVNNKTAAVSEAKKRGILKP